MIVRLMGEGQFRAGDELLGKLNELDDRAQAAADAGDEPELDRLDERAVAALEAGDEQELDARLDDMWRLVQERGERLPDEDLHSSDVLVPPSDLTLEETQRLFSDQGLIPDPPS